MTTLIGWLFELEFGALFIVDILLIDTTTSITLYRRRGMIQKFTVDSHHVFDNAYCVRRKVRSADKQVDHCFQLDQA